MQAHKQSLREQFGVINEHYQGLAQAVNELSVAMKNETLLIPTTIATDQFGEAAEAKSIFKNFETPAPQLTALTKQLEKEIAQLTAQSARKEIDSKVATATMRPLRAQLTQLNKPIKLYHDAVDELLKETKQRIKDWKRLLVNFPDNHYVDVEGLCKIVEREEVEENDYSLTPGRYVGYSIDIDEDFDYQARMAEIHSELSQLNDDANELMKQILSEEV